jgi:anti-sigma B factor antagonist
MSRLDIENVDGVAIARVKEDIDAANATAMHHALADALGPEALCLVVDLGGIRYLDSAGNDMLLRLSDRLEHRRAKLILVIPDGSHLKRLASIVGLPRAITIAPKLSDALAAGAATTGCEAGAPR